MGVYTTEKIQRVVFTAERERERERKRGKEKEGGREKGETKRRKSRKNRERGSANFSSALRWPPPPLSPLQSLSRPKAFIAFACRLAGLSSLHRRYQGRRLVLRSRHSFFFHSLVACTVAKYSDRERSRRLEEARPEAAAAAAAVAVTTFRTSDSGVVGVSRRHKPQ